MTDHEIVWVCIKFFFVVLTHRKKVINQKASKLPIFDGGIVSDIQRGPPCIANSLPIPSWTYLVFKIDIIPYLIYLRHWCCHHLKEQKILDYIH